MSGSDPFVLTSNMTLQCSQIEQEQDWVHLVKHSICPEGSGQPGKPYRVITGYDVRTHAALKIFFPNGKPILREMYGARIHCLNLSNSKGEQRVRMVFRPGREVVFKSVHSLPQLFKLIENEATFVIPKSDLFRLSEVFSSFHSLTKVQLLEDVTHVKEPSTKAAVLQSREDVTITTLLEDVGGSSKGTAAFTDSFPHQPSTETNVETFIAQLDDMEDLLLGSGQSSSLLSPPSEPDSTPAPQSMSVTYECFVNVNAGDGSPCVQKIHSSKSSFLDHLIRVHFYTSLSSELDFLKTTSQEALECPENNCGFIAMRKRDLIKHYSITHKMVHNQLLCYARKTGADTTAAFKFLEEKGFFDPTPSKFRRKPDVACKYCDRWMDPRHLEMHGAFVHFKNQYEKEIKTIQSDFGLSCLQCPGIGCDYTTGTERILMIHYLRKHKPLAAMESASSPIKDPNMTFQNGTKCSFLDPYLLACARDVFKGYVFKVKSPLLSHHPQMEEKIAIQLIECATLMIQDKIGADAVCPLTYCSSRLNDNSGAPSQVQRSVWAAHVLKEHRLEVIASFLHSNGGYSNKKLLKDVLSAADRPVRDFIRNEVLGQGDQVTKVQITPVDGSRNICNSITLPEEINETENPTQEDKVDMFEEDVDMPDVTVHDATIDDIEIKDFHIDSEDMIVRYQNKSMEDLEVDVTNDSYIDALSESGSIEIIASRDVKETNHRINVVREENKDIEIVDLTFAIGKEYGQCEEHFTSSEDTVKNRCSLRSTEDAELSSKTPSWVTTSRKSQILTVASPAPLLVSETKASIRTMVTAVPTLTTVSKAPILTTVSKAPTLTTVSKAPILSTITKPPVLPTISNVLLSPTLTKAPILPTLTSPPILPTLSPPILPTPTSPPILPTLTKAPILPTLTSPLILPTLSPPILPTLTSPPILPTLTKAPILPTLTSSPVLPTLTKVQILPEATILPMKTTSTMSETTATKSQIETMKALKTKRTTSLNSSIPTTPTSIVTALKAPVLTTLTPPPTSTVSDTASTKAGREITDIEVIDIVDAKTASRKRKLEGDNKNSVSGEYFYFCLDCESQRPGCRVPLTLDIASHILQRRHSNFQLIKDVFPDIQEAGIPHIENISYSRKWNKKVTRDWQRMVIAASSGEMEQFKYRAPRKCLKCFLSFHDSADMFLHIRERHVRKK